ncbi:general substrate transporter-4 [Coleophoma crateriformis]|uniref:General substrate transporter-4 n=1 Tax=Coleophoma crateriformis TaxID=565419 RepID=A0A3D8RWB4_9HELO|nr:general substrate transporter-4 [Coleophoma crateriformis]
MSNTAAVTMDAALAGRNTGWFADRGIIKVNLILCISLISSYATGYDASMMNGLQSLDEWNAFFHNPSASTLALLNAIQNVGQLVALPFCAIACDHFGRKPTLLLGAFILLVGVCLQAAAQNNGMFIAARGILGAGLAFNITAAPLLIMELAFPTQKGQLVSIYNALWSLGAIVAAWTTYGTFRILDSWAWRIPSLLQCLSSVIQLGLCFWIVESPRWLVSKDRLDEARDIIITYHANGNPNDPIVIVELEEIREALRLEKEAHNGTSYVSFAKTKGNRLRFMIILAVGFFSQWSGNGLISYYLTLILDSIGYTSQDTQTLINGILTIWGLVTTFGFALLVNRFKRRTMFLASTIGMLVTYIIWTALEATYERQTNLGGTGDPAIAKAVLAMIFIYNAAFAIGWGPLQVTYCVEILPYNLRARGLVLYNLFVALALIFNQYANPIAVTAIKWKYYIVYDVWIFIELIVVYFLFVETQGSSLEEMAAIIDGEEARDTIIEGVARATDMKIESVDEKRIETGVTNVNI